MIWKLHPVTPQKNIIDKTVQGLRDGKIFIVPTDTVYAFVCLLDSPRSINELYALKKLPPTRHLSLLCRDVAMAARYAQNISSPVFRFMKAHTPGPYTFILNAGKDVDRRSTGKKKTVGVRIVDHPFHAALMEQLDTGIVSTSVIQEDEFDTDPEQLHALFGKRVEAVLDEGIRKNEFSTVLDCTEGYLQIVRKGIGDASALETED